MFDCYFKFHIVRVYSFNVLISLHLGRVVAAIGLKSKHFELFGIRLFAICTSVNVRPDGYIFACMYECISKKFHAQYKVLRRFIAHMYSLNSVFSAVVRSTISSLDELLVLDKVCSYQLWLLVCSLNKRL